MPENLQTDTSQTKPPRKINWKFVLIGVFVGFLLIGGGVAIWLLLNQPVTQPPIQTKTSTPSAKTSTTSAQVDKTENWKTIRGVISKWQANEEYKFEFKAPNEFSITKPYPYNQSESDKYYFNAEGVNIKFFAGLMEGPGPLTVLHARAARRNLCNKPLAVQGAEGSYEVCDITQIDDREALFLIEVRIGSDIHASACEQSASLHVVYNLSAGTSLFFTPKLDVLKEIIKPWAKIPTTPVGLDDKGEYYVCPKDIDYNAVKENLKAKINSIRNASGLSETDNQTLKTLYQMLSTFKFLN